MAGRSKAVKKQKKLFLRFFLCVFVVFTITNKALQMCKKASVFSCEICKVRKVAKVFYKMECKGSQSYTAHSGESAKKFAGAQKSTQAGHTKGIRAT